MPTDEDIDHQQELLRIHRGNLALYLKQRTLLGEAYVPPAVINGIDQERKDISHVKETLRSWGVNVQDHPDDPPDSPSRQPAATTVHNATEPLQGNEKDARPPSEALILSKPAAGRARSLTDPLHRVFISYSWFDHKFVTRLATDLKKVGVAVWWDFWEIKAGDSIVRRVEEGIEQSAYLVVVMSPRSVKDNGVQHEIRLARRQNRSQENNIKILPLLLKDCDIPATLKDLRPADFRQGYDQGKRELLDSLGHSSEIKTLPQPWQYVGVLILLALIIISVAALSTWPFSGFQASQVTFPTFTAPTPGMSTAQAQDLGAIPIVQRFPAPTKHTNGLAWDGTSLWITDNSGEIFQVDPSGVSRGSITAPDAVPRGLAWDGAAFWLLTTKQFFVYHFRRQGLTAVTIDRFRAPPTILEGSDDSQDMAWDSSNNILWYATQSKIYKLHPNAGSFAISDTLTFTEKVAALDWDGTNLWLAHNQSSGSVLDVVDATGKKLATFPAPIARVIALAWADGYLWAVGLDASGGSATVYKLDVRRATAAIGY